MRIVLLVAVVIVGLIIGGVLYARHKLAKIFDTTANERDWGDLPPSVALPMMDDQWLDERRRQQASPELAPGAKGGGI